MHLNPLQTKITFAKFYINLYILAWNYVCPSHQCLAVLWCVFQHMQVQQWVPLLTDTFFTGTPRAWSHSGCPGARIVLCKHGTSFCKMPVWCWFQLFWQKRKYGRRVNTMEVIWLREQGQCVLWQHRDCDCFCRELPVLFEMLVSECSSCIARLCDIFTLHTSMND